MKYIPNTKKDFKEMLEEMGEDSFESFLSKIIPENLRFEKDLEIGSPHSEFDLMLDVDKMKSLNKNLINFNGGGVYDHYIPSVVDFISSIR